MLIRRLIDRAIFQFTAAGKLPQNRKMYLPDRVCKAGSVKVNK
jgi:hypothetical protein